MKTRHDGDCSIYAALVNTGMPEAGICTCGYGHQLKGQGDYSQMYSGELLKKLEEKARKENKGKTISLEDVIKMMKEGWKESKRTG